MIKNDKYWLKFLVLSGAWGYGSKFEKLETQLLAKFDEKIKVIGKATPNVTGYFEVQVKDGPLVWSKKKTNKFPTSRDDLLAIYDAIEKELNKNANGDDNGKKKEEAEEKK